MKNNNICIMRLPAKWVKHGRLAGFLRNSAMLYYADACVAIWDGSSRGTADTIDKCKIYNVPLYIHKVTNESSN